VPKSSAAGRRRTLAALPLLLVVAYGAAFAATALGTSVPGLDDHPGQLYRLWHVVTLGPAPWAWNEGWWTGYPELQFYPPAFAYAGGLLHALSAGTLGVAAAYQVLVWLAYLAPGLTTLLALTRMLASAWLALPGAALALTLSLWPVLASGVEGGVHVGMAPARLGWALLPLLLAVLARRSEGPFPVRAVAALTAAILLCHPAHLPAALVLVALTALANPPRWRRLGVALGSLSLAALLAAFWTVPLLARLGETRALAWNELWLQALGEIPHRHPLALVLLGLALAALPVARATGTRGAMVLAAFPWAMALVVAAVALGLEPLGLRWLPADRVMDGFWLAVVLAATLGWSGLRLRLRAPPVILGAAGVALVVAGSVGTDTLTLWPRPGTWPTHAATARGLRLPALWSTLREAPPGRVLFVRSSVPLVYGAEWWRPHTHATALAPRESGRPIVNGTFTHPSPVAAFVYRGSALPAAITRLVERLDGEVLFGTSLDALEAATLNAHARRLRVSVIVALEDDLPRLAALVDNPVFARRRAEPPFVVWLGPPAALPERLPDGRRRATLEPSADGWASAGLAYYPLWRATAAGRALPTRRGPAGDLEVHAPDGHHVIELDYRPGAPELTGLALSAAGLLLWAVGPRYLRTAAPASAHS
jgi:hypothetical protein